MAETFNVPALTPVHEPIQAPFNFTMVDQHGKVLSRGATLTMPQLEGQRGIEGHAPPGTYRDGDAWVALPAQPGPAHAFDWVSKTWRDARGLDEFKAELTAAATAKRWLIETGGLTLPSGVRVLTAATDQARITSVLVNAQRAGATSVDFKAASGWVTLRITELEAIANAIALHVQACFTAERAHHEAIASLTTLAAARTYDVERGWPAAVIPAT